MVDQKPVREEEGKSTRRKFVASGVGSLCALGTWPVLAHGVETKPAIGDDMKCLDYGLSFLSGTKSFNTVRFWIESRTIIVHEDTKVRQVFYQCASCKSENTFGDKDLFLSDNYDFMPIFGGKDMEDLLIFRRHSRLTKGYRSIVKSKDVWGKPDLKQREAGKVSVLDTWEKIRDTTASGTPIVSRTIIRNTETKLRAIIECPVKTMNISLDKKMYQVDTGPIAYPDLTNPARPLIKGLSLAFVAFNAPHFADFVIEQPTPVMEDKKELCKIYHYSNPISFPAENHLLALEPAE